MFATIAIGGYRVHRPAEPVELQVKAEIIAKLAEREWPSVLTDPDEVNQAVQLLLSIAAGIFDQAASDLASRDLAEFLLTQHATWEQIRKAAAAGKLRPDEVDYFSRYGVTAKRAILYALERVVVVRPPEVPGIARRLIKSATDRLMISAEIMTNCAAWSAMAYDVFPGECELRVELDRPERYFDFAVVGEVAERKDQLLIRRGAPRPAAYRQFMDGDVGGQVAALNPVFESEFGIDLQHIVAAAYAADKYSRKAPGKGFDVRFVLEDAVLDGTSQNLRIDRDILAAPLDAFVLRPELAEDRLLWSPKQPGRVLRRPYMEFPHKSGRHLAWDSSLVAAGLPMVLQDLAFRRCPPEWQRPAITAALTTYSQALDRDWEHEIRAQLATRGITGLGSVKKLKGDDGVKVFLKDVGEIDGLLVDSTDDSLVVGEFKRTQPTYGPLYWRNEAAEYLRGPKSYVAKHRKKVEWVKTNWEVVCQHLHREGHLSAVPSSQPRVRPLMVTRYPGIAGVLDPTWPIHCLAWLLEDYDGTGVWPF